MRARKMTHVVKCPKSFNARFGWSYETERRNVTVLAISGRYAMVRRPGYAPYVCPVKELEPETKP